MLPEVVSHYRIKRRLGAGGMGEVYLADDLTLKRQVAIKLLTSKDLSDDQVRKNLLREAQAAASLDHPNICSVFEVGTDGDLSFIVMQYVEGETLLARLERSRPTPDEALDIASQVADALAAAHRKSVVHRDIKPQNIMLTPRGGLKVLDFGLAKRAQVGPASEEMTQSTAGQGGAVAGTAPYMFPEQVKQEPVDGRSDLFALGATYYECLTGRRAFSGKTSLEICGQVLHVDPPAPSSINDQLGPAHDELCRQLLTKDPERRVQTGEEAIRLLDMARQTGTVTPGQWSSEPVPALGWTMGRVLRPQSLGALGALAALVLVMSWWQPWSSTEPTGTEQAALRQAVAGSETEQRYLVVMPLDAAALEDQALSEGLTDALTSKLSQLSRSHGLQVASTSMVRELDQASVSGVGTELGVTRAVLCGVHRDGQQLSVELTLVEAPGGREISTDTVTVAQDDPFLLLDHVLVAATGLLDIELEPRELDAMRTYGTEVPEAYYLYLQGRGYLERLDRDRDIDRAISTFNRVLDLDPDYALAHAGLGSAYWQKYDQTNQPDQVLQAATACQTAVELDDQQGRRSRLSRYRVWQPGASGRRHCRVRAGNRSRAHEPGGLAPSGAFLRTDGGRRGGRAGIPEGDRDNSESLGRIYLAWGVLHLPVSLC
jgi:serine/threonine-protein kinase